MGADQERGPAGVPQVVWGDMGTWEKLKYVVMHVTVEPILLFLLLPSTLSALAVQNMYIEKACRVNLNYSAELCTQLMDGVETNETKKVLLEAETLVSWMQTWKTVVTYLPPTVLMLTVLMLFLGSWSDRHGRRKPFILLPIAGDMATNLGFLACTYFFQELPMEVAGAVEAVFPALAGGLFTMLMGVFSYLADITSVENRTQRIGIANIFISVCTPVGSALSGVITKYLGYYGAFSISLALTVTGFVYCLLRVEEARPPGPVPGGVGFLRDVFDCRHVRETFLVGFKEREGDRRKWIVLLIVLSVMIVGPVTGEFAVGYLYTFNRFNWREVDFSIFATCAGIVNFVGTTVGITLFVKVLKVSDSVLGFIGCVGKILASLAVCFASQSWMMYLGLALDFFGGMTLVALRAIGSKIVPCNEQGKLNSLFGVFESLAPLAYSTLYTSVYAVTADTFPGAVYLMNAVFAVPIATVFMLMHCMAPLKADEDREKLGVFPDSGPRPGLELGHYNFNSGFQGDEEGAAPSLRESKKL